MKSENVRFLFVVASNCYSFSKILWPVSFLSVIRSTSGEHSMSSW